MTTFTTKNQSRKRYYRAIGAAVIILILVSFIIFSRRDRNNVSNGSQDSQREQRLNNKNGAATDKRRAPFYSDELIEYEPTIHVQGLDIKGQVRTLSNGKTVASYLGVPYAEPPIDDRRFSSPQFKKLSAGENDSDESASTLDAFYQPFKCYQSSYILSITEVKKLGDESKEDCLYLNIWAPYQEGCNGCNESESDNPKIKKPVMVFIHSGLFQYGGIGSPDLDPSLLVSEKDIIVVTIQYRLGIFGFGSSEQQLAAENFQSLGLQDQAKALEWVKKNIGSFGGDPNRITLSGHGAGAISIGFHLMHSRTKKMFQRAMMQGVQNIWNIGIYGMNAKSVRYLMEDSTCDEETVKNRDLKMCIEKNGIQPIVLLEGQQYLVDSFAIPFVPEFNPLTKKVVEKIQPLTPEDKFNDTLLQTIFKDWNIFSPDHEIMIGINSDDDYQFEKVNKVSTKVRFGDQSDEEYDYEDSADSDDEEEEGKSDDNDEEERGEHAENKVEMENEENEEEEENGKTNPEDNKDNETNNENENMDLGDEIKVENTSAENDNTNLEQTETTTMMPATTSDDLIQHRRRKRRIPQKRRQKRQTANLESKLDNDEIVKLCRLVKMYQIQKKNNGGTKVSQKITIYRVDPKVLVSLLEEVSFAFGAKKNWLKNLDNDAMNIWGSFVNDGLNGLRASNEKLSKYESKISTDKEPVQMVNIGQMIDDENHSQISIKTFDWSKLCSTQ